ncbi:hypothetical protein C8034_v007540 [Colletotrichum sidae]|uniref:Uncharacterized protein n=2 Tax=Colletotrichum orbiculare species complex TaxID=2707354 RepID=A0A4V3HXK0_COLTR|nr:hypothetical protein CTRI78_v000428 [Colletotrichum trifolii]TEA11446.1 hypothetical protein C8034_v007540 [Colletotrichum sidae]
MSAPRTKRPFAGAAADPSQRQITSFFAPRSGPAPASPPTTTPNAAEKLPTEVQSNLLSVGMRVRKSVPEGYKTGTYSSFKLWSDQSTVSRPTASTKKRSTAASSQRELMPFCGINKIGGLSAQPVGSSDDEDYERDIPGLDDIPGLSSSQESVESVESTSSDTPSRKRFYDADEEGANNEATRMWTDRSAWLEGEVSPRSPAPSGFANSRPLAVPRKSRFLKLKMEQENVVADDFEDADFLVAPDTDMSDA